MRFILCYTVIVMLRTPTIIHTQSSVVTSEGNSKLANDTEEKGVKHLEDIKHVSSDELSEQNYADEDVEETDENYIHEQAEVSNDLLDANFVSSTISSSGIRFNPDTALPQEDETTSDLMQESSSQSQEFEFEESTLTDLNRPGRDFIGHSPISMELKTTQLLDTDEISEVYKSSGSEDTLSNTNNQLTQRIEKEYSQHLSSEETRIGHTNEPVNKPLESDQTETPVTEVVEKTRLNQTEESFPKESANVIRLKSSEQSENDGDINEANNIVLKASSTELNPNVTEEVENGSEFNEQTSLDQTGESLRIESSNAIGLKSSEQSENDGDINEANHIALKASSTELNPKVSAGVENGFEFNEETRLDQTGESPPRELVSTFEWKSTEQAETEGNIHEGTFLESTKERRTQEMAGNTGLNLKKLVEVEYGFKPSEDIHLNQTVGSFMRKSIDSNESKPAEQLEDDDSLKSSDQNRFNEDSGEKRVNEDETKIVPLFNSSSTKSNRGNMADSESEMFDHISNLNSQTESKLFLDPFQHTNNNYADNVSNKIELFHDAALPKEKANAKVKFIPSNNANNIYLGGNAKESENLQTRNIGSDRSTSFTSETENDTVVGSSKQFDSMHITNYQSEADNLMQNSTESLVLKDDYKKNNSDEVKVNERYQSELDTCEESRCLETATSTDYESADFSSELIPKIQKERIRAVGRVLANAMNTTLLLNGSAHKENQSAYEYLENIEFNLHEVIHLIKTDSNVRAAILNIIILYVPVLICDVFLWIVIVKLIRHIRRFLVSNKEPKPGQSLLTHENESGEVDRPINSNINSDTKSKRAVNSIEDDLCESNSKLSEQKVWYPPS